MFLKRELCLIKVAIELKAQLDWFLLFSSYCAMSLKAFLTKFYYYCLEVTIAKLNLCRELGLTQILNRWPTLKSLFYC